MTKILSAKAGKLSMSDAFLIAGVKTFEERFLSKYIGNATVMSGGIKLVGAVLLQKVLGGKWGDIVGTALTVDGTEDVVNNLLGTGAIPLLSGGVQSGSEVI